MSIRTMHRGYIERVDVFFEHLIPLVANLQFTKGNGPIIAVQVNMAKVEIYFPTKILN
jgi:hypothetical protein